MYNHDLSQSTEYKFNSMSEFGHHFERIQPRRGNAAKTASSKWTANSAANGMSLGDAVDLAKRGGVEDVPKMLSLRNEEARECVLIRDRRPD